MNVGVVIAIVGALAWLPGIYGVIEAIRRHRESVRQSVDEGDRLVVQSAIQLLAPYKTEVAELKKNLKHAAETIDDLKTQLDDANKRASSLNAQLVDAQTELSYLRVQVKIMSQQISNK